MGGPGHTVRPASPLRCGSRRRGEAPGAVASGEDTLHPLPAVSPGVHGGPPWWGLVGTPGETPQPARRGPAWGRVQAGMPPGVLRSTPVVGLGTGTKGRSETTPVTPRPRGLGCLKGPGGTWRSPPAGVGAHGGGRQTGGVW